MSATATHAYRAPAIRRTGVVWTPPARLGDACRSGDDFLAAASAGPEDRVLVVGGERADLLCAALRRGCRSALGVVAPQRHPEPADLVVAPRVASREDAFAVADCARRALRGGGRLAIGLLGAAAADLARAVARGLQDYGFTRARLRARAEGGVLLVCEFPMPASDTTAARSR